MRRKLSTVVAIAIFTICTPLSASATGTIWCHAWIDTGKRISNLDHLCRATQRECLATIADHRTDITCVAVNS
jgi:hypothetical protein